MPPLITQKRVVVTVHDLLQIRFSSAAKVLYFNAILKQLLIRADKIVTDSEFSRQEILSWTNRKPQDVEIIPLGLSKEFDYTGDKYFSKKPYFLYVGNHRSHKNLKRLIQAFSMFDVAKEHQLLLTGQPDRELTELAAHSGVADRLSFIGFPAALQLAKLYRGAVATMYISLYEGFGLPLIESMACGTIVVGSKVPAVEETAGGAAFLVDPTNIEEIADGMKKVTFDGNLRQDLIERGFHRSKEFSWERSFSLLSNLLESIG